MARIVAATTPEERNALQLAAIERVPDRRFERPVPQFITELPFADPDEITDRIAAQVLTAADPDAAQAPEDFSIASKDITGKACTIHEMFVLATDKPNGWGAYLLLDCTIGDDPEHKAVNTGAKQAIVVIARAWASGRFPLEGAFAAIEGTGKRGNEAVTFVVDRPF